MSSKSDKFADAPWATNKPVECALSGPALLQSPYFNKGSAFSAEERRTFGLRGLLPANIQVLDDQVKRAYDQYSSCSSDLAKNTFMTSMKEQNETLYYRLIMVHLKEMFSIIYTPTEGEAIADYSRIFRRPEGCFLSVNDIDLVEDQLDAFGDPEHVDIVVVSDGEQILGIGDQGVGGILISVAKLVLYTLCAGIHPHRTLPVVLDCGTDNKELLKDPLYMGNRHERVRGERYDAFVDKFVDTVKKRYPKAYLHFEDFGLTNARRILDKYTGKISCFNDDVQGTGCVTLAAIYAATHVAGIELKDLRVVMFGSGTAGTGIADQIADAIQVESGRSAEEARNQIFCVDKPGLLTTKTDLTAAQKQYAKDDSRYPSDKHRDLLSVINSVKPHVLIGTSTQPGAFTQQIIEAMAKQLGDDARPIIFPLSNPTKLHEAVPKDLLHWTSGRALVATGSPFDPVEINGKKIEIAECNNSCCFPGIGLGVVLCGAKLVTKELLVAATKALAAKAPAMEDKDGALLPDVVDVREISLEIAVAVIKEARKKGLATVEGIPGDEDLREWVSVQMWTPEYRELKKVDYETAEGMARGEVGSKGRRHAPDAA